MKTFKQLRVSVILLDACRFGARSPNQLSSEEVIDSLEAFGIQVNDDVDWGEEPNNDDQAKRFVG